MSQYLKQTFDWLRCSLGMTVGLITILSIDLIRAIVMYLRVQLGKQNLFFEGLSLNSGICCYTIFCEQKATKRK